MFMPTRKLFLTSYMPQLPDWAFEIGLTKDNMRDMTMNIIERKFTGGKNEYDGVEDGEERLKRKKEKQRRKEEAAKVRAGKGRRRAGSSTVLGGVEEKEEPRPVVLAMKNLRKGGKGGLLTRGEEEEEKEVERMNRTMYERMGFKKLPPSSGSSGVRVSIAANGDILSTVKPEFEHLMSKPCLYSGQDRLLLTQTRRPATTPNPCLDYDVFRQNKTRVLDAMKNHRRAVWLEKQTIDSARQSKVLANIEAKETRREGRDPGIANE